MSMLSLWQTGSVSLPTVPAPQESAFKWKYDQQQTNAAKDKGNVAGSGGLVSHYNNKAPK